MNASLPDSTTHPRPRSSRSSGMALVMVLSVIALLMVLVLGVLSMSSVETKSASTYATITDVRSLADLPLNVVMGQIRQATTGLGDSKTWTSQPGMIRVFGLEPGSHGRSKLDQAWKLYSSDVMVSSGAFDPVAESLSLAGWSGKKALFTDLNEPVVTATGTGTSAQIQRTYPIMDVSVFDIDGDGIADSPVGKDGRIEGAQLTSSLPDASSTHPLPMPVRWLYLLQDGRLVAPTGESGGVATFDATTVSTTNPITGRIAFWADDESTKLNINTASEGVPWDVPRTTSWQDQNWAIYLPGQNEFQRFPGHPAMTSLSSVLQSFDPTFTWQGLQMTTPYNGGGARPDNASYTLPSGKAAYTNQNYLKNIYDMLPRTNWGDDGQSSRGGTVIVSSETGLPIRRERLFASVDEFFYGSDRQQNGPAGSVDGRDIRAARAFLTAHSRAPETNLFNRPRISLWPIFADPDVRNPKDKLLAFAATSAGQTAAFYRAQRWVSDNNPGSSQSPTEDFLLPHNQRLFRYLQSLSDKGVPGFGSDSFQSKYSTVGINQILLQIFDLQRWGVNSWYAVKSAGGAIDQGKSYSYVPPRDFIRTGTQTGGLGEASAVPVKTTSMPNGDATPASGQKGFGRWPSIVEASVVFMAAEAQGLIASRPVTSTDSAALPRDLVKNFPSTGAGSDGWADRTTKMRAFIILQPFTPVVGMPPSTANIRYRIKGLENWKINGTTPLFAQAGTANTVRAFTSNAVTGENAHMTGYSGLQGIIGGKSATPGNENSGYAFISSAPIDISTMDTFFFPGSTAPATDNSGVRADSAGEDITIEIFSGYGSEPAQNAEPLQTITLRFPTIWTRTPKLKTGSATHAKLMNPVNRFDKSSFQAEVINYGDVVRSVVVDASPTSPSGGDYRLLVARPVVPSNYFAPHPDYYDNPQDPAYQFEAQSLRYASKTHEGHFGHRNIPTPSSFPVNAEGNQHVWQTAGYEFPNGTNLVANIKKYGLLKDVMYWQDCQPAHPVKLNGAYNADGLPGDWDNGVGRVEDGPYINKPDEGGFEGGNGNQANSDDLKYFSRSGYSEDTGKAYSPNRQIASGIAFGSLPSGVYGTSASAKPRPWQTLLFCPNPPSRTTAALDRPDAVDHFGFGGPRDHLLLENFWMPIVEPYAISEPFSTAGKVNMNYQMVPFSYLQRATGIHAALRSVRVRAMPSALAYTGNNTKSSERTIPQLEECYKPLHHWMKYETTYEVNVPETLKPFRQRFETQKDVFRSASEICDIFLVPRPISSRTYSNAAGGKARTSPAYEDMTEWWNGSLDRQDDGMELTGDNSRESPYNQLYPRLTTRSNVFQVHYRVQTLKKARSSAATTWDEAKDAVTADYRGSAMVERYLDPNTASLPNFIEDLGNRTAALDDYYRFRIIQKKQFAP